MIDDVLLEKLPVQIAERAKVISVDPNDRVRLWTAFEISEAVLRWIFATTASAMHKKHGRLPDKLLRQIAYSIKQPTLGSWCVMNEALSRALAKESHASSFGQAFAEFYLKFSDHPELGDVWTRITDWRNVIAHGGGLTSAQARNQWRDMEAVLRHILTELANVHSDYDVVATLSGQVFDLTGPVPKLLETPPEWAANRSQDNTWLVQKGGEFSSLRPLLTYEPIEEVWEIDQFRTKEDALRAPVPQSYFKLSEEKLYYIPIGVDDFVSIGRDANRFKSLFPDPLKSGDATLQDRFFQESRLKHLSRFIGRAAELTALEKWLAAHVPTGDMLGLVVGGPGLGKSALIARAAMDQVERNTALNRGDRKVVYHAFNAENPSNDRRLFLHNLRQQLQLWLEKKVVKSSTISDVPAAEDSVRTLLEQAVGGDSHRHLTIFVDGLDEIRSKDRDFPKYLVEMIRAGITIVASTRNEEFVADFDAALKVERIEFRNGAVELPGMYDNDVRALLLQNLGARGREIIALDADTDDSSGVRNPYLEKVVTHAAGKPLYVELLVSDLLDNNARIDPNVRLPASMGEYYGKLLARQGVSDTKAHLAIIICILALVEEPLSEPVISDLLALAPNSLDAADRSDVWAREALNQGEVFFSRLAMPDGSDAIAIYHQELKNYIKEAGQLRWANGVAAWLLAVASAEFEMRSVSSVTMRHFRRFGASYLLDHARKVQPAPVSGDVEEFIHDAFLTAPMLMLAVEAWREDRENYLRTFGQIDRKLRANVGDDPQPRVASFLEVSLNRSGHGGLGPSVVHSILGYDDAYSELYAGMLSTVLSASFLAGLDPSVSSDPVIADWMANAIGQDRRGGRLDLAEERFGAAMDRLALVDPEGSNKQANVVRAKLEYERAYCAYFRGDAEESWKIFELSAEAAKLAEDRSGLHIAKSVQQNVRIRFARARGELNIDLLVQYEQFLNEQIVVLQSMVAAGSDERERTTAERWVMNCKAHLCGVAFLKGDRSQMRVFYDVLVDDPWIKKQGDSLRKAILNRIEPRLAMVEENLEAAITLYRKLCPGLTSETSPGARGEGVAEYYFEFAKLLISDQRFKEADRVIESGLATHDTFANAMWKPSLLKCREELTG